MAAPQKNFPKRTAILSFLRQTKDHPSAEMVYNHLKLEIPDLSLGTIYRNLNMFKNSGEIVSLGTVNGVERFDAIVEPHVHFICSGCGAVLDLPQIEVPEDLNRQVSKATGGLVEACNLAFTGQCKDCLKKQGGITA